MLLQPRSRRFLNPISLTCTNPFRRQSFGGCVYGFGYIHVNGMLNDKTLTQKPSVGTKLFVAGVPSQFFHWLAPASDRCKQHRATF